MHIEWTALTHTSAISFNDVSLPRLKSVPGTLLLMVAGIVTIGMQNSGYLERASVNSRRLWYAYKLNTTQWYTTTVSVTEHMQIYSYTVSQKC